MQISLSWVQQFVSLKTDNTEKLMNVLTERAAEIDGIIDSSAHLKNVVTGKILEINPHPDADKVRITKTEVGNGEVLQIICGAKNIKEGQIVPVALVGAVLPGNFEISERKMRGVMSYGMLCSGKELGITEDAQGILILEKNLPVGIPLADALGLGGEVFDVDNTAITNRPDLFSQLGFARELVALGLAEWKYSSMQKKELIINNEIVSVPEISKYNEKTQQTIFDIIKHLPSSTLPKKINVDDPELFPVRANIVLTNITIKPSPQWMQTKLNEVGIRPINNIVDISNFVMMELGMPLHIFDIDTINGDITMRASTKGEKIITLDNEEHELPEGVIVQEDDDKIFDLAGIMGGKNSEITEKTKNILVHVPVYDPIRIRKAALALAHRTDAATMYEKRVPNASVLPGMLRTLQLIQELCPEAKTVSDIEYKEYIPAKKREITFPLAMASRMIGKKIPVEEIISSLEKLEFTVQSHDNEFLHIIVPPHRLGDISIAEDIAEEIVRIHGLNAIEAEAPNMQMHPTPLSPVRKIRREITDTLLSQDFFEILSFAFLGPQLLEKCGITSDKTYIEIANPLSRDQSLMRQSLFPRLFEKAEENLRHRSSFSLFEIGKTFIKNTQNSCDETLEISGICVEKEYAYGKGVVEFLASSLDIPLRFLEGKNIPPFAAKGADIFLGKECVGSVFLPTKIIKKSFDIPENTSCFSLNLSALAEFPRKPRKILPAPKFPEVEYDISILADEKTLVSDVLRAVKNTDRLISSSEILEIFTGNSLPEGKKSITLRFVFRADDRTLSAEDVEILKKKVIADLAKKGFKERF